MKGEGCDLSDRDEGRVDRVEDLATFIRILACTLKWEDCVGFQFKPREVNFLLLLLHSVACGNLVLQPRIEPRSSTVKVWGPNHWTARKFLYFTGSFWVSYCEQIIGKQREKQAS